MRIEITFQNKTDTIVLPPDIDLVGISLKDSKNTLNIYNPFPKTLCEASVQCKTQRKQLPDGAVLTLYLYQFSEKAKVLSLKEYIGLVHWSILCGELGIHFIVS